MTAPKLTEPGEKLLTDELRKFNEQIAAKQAELQSVKTDIKAAKIRRGQAERRLKESQAKQDNQEVAYSKREKELKSQLEDLASSVVDGEASAVVRKLELDAQVAVSQAALKSTNHDIKERAQYLKEQETVIHNTLEDGEARLADLDYEVKQIIKQQQEALQQVEQLTRTNEELRIEIAEANEKKAKLSDVYTGAAAQYKRALEELYTKIEQQAEKYRVQLATAKTLASRLTTKEHELDEREQVLEEREQKVAEDRRFIESRKYMYGKE